MIDRKEILLEGCRGAYGAALLGWATAIATGAAITTTPVTVLGIITIGTTTAVSLPIAVTCAGVAGAAAGTASAIKYYRAQKELDDTFEAYMRKEQSR